METKKWAMIGASAGFVSWLLAWVYSAIFGQGGAGTVTFASIGDINVRNQILNGFDKSLASQLLNALGGNFTAITGGVLGALIMAVLAGVVIAVVGRFIYNVIPLGNTPKTRLVAVLVYGSVVSGWIVGFMTGAGTGAIKLPALNVMLAMVLYFLIVGVAMAALSDTEIGSKYIQVPQ